MAVINIISESNLLTFEEVASYDERQKTELTYRPSTKSFPAGRTIPSEFEQDLTAGEDE